MSSYCIILPQEEANFYVSKVNYRSYCCLPTLFYTWADGVCRDSSAYEGHMSWMETSFTHLDAYK